MSKINVSVDPKAARRAGYDSREAAEQAGRRALRWLRAPRNNGAKAPGHIQEKINLLRMFGDGRQA